MATLKTESPWGSCCTAHDPAGFNTIPVWMLPSCCDRQTCLPWSLGGPCIPPVLITQNSLRPTSQAHNLTLITSRSRSNCTFLTLPFLIFSPCKPRSAQNSCLISQFKKSHSKNFHKYQPHLGSILSAALAEQLYAVKALVLQSKPTQNG